MREGRETVREGRETVRDERKTVRDERETVRDERETVREGLWRESREANFRATVPDGVLQYNLTTPISFQSGDVLGVYQPAKGDSVVRVYYREVIATVTIYRNSDSPMSSVSLNDLTTVMDQEILITPISG